MKERLFTLIVVMVMTAIWLGACSAAQTVPTSGPEAGTPVGNANETGPATSQVTAAGSAAVETMTETMTGTAPGETERTVFLIVMENTNWSEIVGNNDAPYINTTLLPMASYAGQYYNPPGLHPSEPNYLWMEAGTNFGITDDKGPDVNHQDTTKHLVTLLKQQGIAWKSYQEDINGNDCPLANDGLYAPKHNPMIYFDDVTDGNDPQSANCIQHVRPYAELGPDLATNAVAGYNFITPNLCNDMHGGIHCLISNRIRNGDTWLADNVPAILDSQAYKDGGILFITWDEGEDKSDGPIGMIVLSPDAKGGGYTNDIHYTHSSLLRTLQEIYGVTPLLGDAAQATNLSDLFVVYP